MNNQKTRQTKSHCPFCGPGKYANVLHSHEATRHDEETDVWETTKSYMLECGGCKTVFF
jgi:hypothetical protein